MPAAGDHQGLFSGSVRLLKVVFAAPGMAAVWV
jgi:hypothetical protein